MYRGLWLWEAQSVVFDVFGWGLGGSICRIVHAARRPADPVYFYPCFSLRRLVPAPRSSPRDQFVRAFRRIALIGASTRRRVVLSRNDVLIPNSESYSELVVLPRNDDLIPKAMLHDDVDDALSVRHWRIALSSACGFEVGMRWERFTPT